MAQTRLLTLACLLLYGFNIQANQITTDDFNDPNINPFLWSAYLPGTGPFITRQNGRVEITIPSNSHGNGVFGVAYQSGYDVEGDFDFQADFTLLNWPNETGVRTGIGLSIVGTAVARVSLSAHDYAGFGGDFYLTDFGSVAGITPTTDQSGRLRLVRSGSLLSGYFWNGQSWTLMSESNGFSGDGFLSLAVWSHDQFFEHTDVSIAFDNVQFDGNLVLAPIITPGLPGAAVPEGWSALSSNLTIVLSFSSLLALRRCSGRVT